MNNKLRIIFVPHNGKPYGANKSLLSLIKYLSDNHEVALLTSVSNSLRKDYDEIETKQIIVPFFPTLFFIRKKIRYILFPFLQVLNILVFPILIYKIRKFRPDIIYSNSSMENMGWVLSKFLRVKHITHVREFGDLDYSFVSIFGSNFKRWYLNQSEGVIFNSNEVQDHVLPTPLQEILCKTIYNGIKCNTNSFEVKNIFKSIINIGIVGYIHLEKGQLEALDFLRDLLLNRNDLILNIYGDGESAYISKLKQFIINNNLEDKVNFAGFVSNVNEIYSFIDVLVVFSKNEAFGRVTIEAMNAGVPVFGFNGGGTPELITDGVDGFLFDDKNSFCDKFEKLIDNHKLYEFISINSKIKVSTRFSEEIYTKNIEAFLIEIFNN